MRIVSYCQSSSGIGHLVRAAAIARALAERHQVTFVVGGRVFAGSPAVGPFTTVQLEPLARVDGRLRPVDATRELGEVMNARAAAFREVVARVRPDVILVEHFPVSRWAHREEILGGLDAAPGARVVASVRDIVLKGSFDPTAPDDPTPLLNDRFDLLLVHGDPRVTRLEEQVAWAARIAVPVVYTGYVCAAAPRACPEAEALRPFVLVSGGGGKETAGLASACLDAWSRLEDPRRLVIFAGPVAPADVVADLERRAGPRVHVARATGDLAGWMAAAALSISRAGYNTCVDVLAARARALLVPSPIMSDQRLRADRFAALGLARTIADEEATPDRLAQAISAGAEPPAAPPALDGAARAVAAIEALA